MYVSFTNHRTCLLLSLPTAFEASHKLGATISQYARFSVISVSTKLSIGYWDLSQSITVNPLGFGPLQRHSRPGWISENPGAEKFNFWQRSARGYIYTQVAESLKNLASNRF